MSDDKQLNNQPLSDNVEFGYTGSEMLTEGHRGGGSPLQHPPQGGSSLSPANQPGQASPSSASSDSSGGATSTTNTNGD